MSADRDQTRILPLLLSACLVLLTAVQFVRPLLTAADNTPSVAGPGNLLRTHTREEVGGRGLDLSSEARVGSRLLLREGDRETPRPDSADHPEVTIAPTRLLIHRKVAPPTSDDAFPC